MAAGFRVMGVLLGAALALSGCGTDLGQCDEAALTAAMPSGQSIVGSSCGGGRCHSEQAFGELRVGAPADLDFDVSSAVPAVRQRALATVRDEKEDIWSEIDGDTMPPPPPAAMALDAAQKEAVRNWLACGAPDTPTAPPVGDDWSTIHAALTTCNACHGAAFATVGNGFELGADACMAWRNVVNQPAVTTMGMCNTSGLQLVVPGDPDNSLLLQKLESTMPACGMPMPLGPTPLSATDPSTVALLRTWIAAGATAPAGCTP